MTINNLYLIVLWQGHGPGKFFSRSANFPHSIEIFYIYFVWPGLAQVFLVSVSFGPGTFNGQNPPLIRTMKI
ncbi:hypothetical protein Hanom_Chr10g00945031 [Helianthus anomalus]